MRVDPSMSVIRNVRVPTGSGRRTADELPAVDRFLVLPAVREAMAARAILDALILCVRGGRPTLSPIVLRSARIPGRFETCFRRTTTRTTAPREDGTAPKATLTYDMRRA